MANLGTWRKLISTALFALVITFVSLGPSLESLLCHEEGGAVAAALSQDSFTAPDAPADDHDAEGPCVHGHCHHVVAFAPPMAAAALIPAISPIERTTAEDRLLYSDPTFGLKRPPRI